MKLVLYFLFLSFCLFAPQLITNICFSFLQGGPHCSQRADTTNRRGDGPHTPYARADSGDYNLRHPCPVSLQPRVQYLDAAVASCQRVWQSPLRQLNQLMSGFAADFVCHWMCLVFIFLSSFLAQTCQERYWRAAILFSRAVSDRVNNKVTHMYTRCYMCMTAFCSLETFTFITSTLNARVISQALSTCTSSLYELQVRLYLTQGHA